MPNWKDAPTNEKLMAALVASIENKINYNEVARYFGEGTTYSSIENRLRSTRKLSDELRVAVGEEPFGKGAKPKSSAGATAPRNGSNSNGVKSTKPARKKQKNTNGDAVITGRVSKSTSKSITPTANRKKAATEEAVKKEIKDEPDYSEEDINLLQKDSSDEIFDLNSYDGSVDDFDFSSSMDCQ